MGSHMISTIVIKRPLGVDGITDIFNNKICRGGGGAIVWINMWWVGPMKKLWVKGQNVLVRFETIGMWISTINKLKLFQASTFIYFVLYIIFTITSWMKQTCTHFCYVHNNLNFLFDTWITFAQPLLNNWRFSNIDIMPPFFQVQIMEHKNQG